MLASASRGSRPVTEGTGRKAASRQVLLARPAFLDEFLAAPLPVSSAPVEGEGRKSEVSSHQQRGSTSLNSSRAELIASDVAQARSTTSLTSGSPTRSILGSCLLPSDEQLSPRSKENEGSLLRKSLRPLEDHPIKRFIRESTNGTNSCETRGGGEKGGALFGEKGGALFGSSLRPSTANRPNTGDAPTAKEDIRPEISYSSLLEERREQNLAAANAKAGVLPPNSRNSLFDKHKQTISEGALEGRRIWGNSCADKGTLSPIGPYVAEFFAKTPPHCGSGRRSATSRPSTFGLLEQSQQHRFEARPRRRSMGSETRAVAVAGQLQLAEAYLLEIEAKLELSGAEAAAQAQDVAEKLARIAEARERLGQRDNVSKDLAAFRDGKRQQLDRAEKAQKARAPLVQNKASQVLSRSAALDTCMKHVSALKRRLSAKTKGAAEQAAEDLRKSQDQIVEALRVKPQDRELKQLREQLHSLGSLVAEMAVREELPAAGFEEPEEDEWEHQGFDVEVFKAIVATAMSAVGMEDQAAAPTRAAAVVREAANQTAAMAKRLSITPGMKAPFAMIPPPAKSPLNGVLDDEDSESTSSANSATASSQNPSPSSDRKFALVDLDEDICARGDSVPKLAVQTAKLNDIEIVDDSTLVVGATVSKPRRRSFASLAA
mmetsp:Transcript_29577/g.78256  ORF Transcript_29577/g.78256 Transcript_29577/m.78256 type:complete len:661 (-) Transcript_29577:275-2257(-)